MTSNRDAALNNIILLGEVGSTAHGTGIDGQEDRDEMGIFVEPPVSVCGLSSIDHYIQRDKPDGVRSEPGDLDLTLYSLRKFCRLAAGGNPSVLMLLWLSTYLTVTPLGQSLVSMRTSFLSKRCGESYLGYLTQQRMRLTGERSKNVSRPELVERYGYDTKFAMHALRLGLQGIEVMTTGNLSIPVPEPNRRLLRSVRGGELPLTEALTLISETESRLRALVDACTWNANIDAINAFLVTAHREHWEATRAP
jgi:predicted nucleotidyltransferase